MTPPRLEILHTKGELISKCLFDIFNSSKNQTKKSTWILWYLMSCRIVYVRFLEELKTPKRHFEINWPLSTLCHVTHRELSTDPHPPLLVQIVIEWPLSSNCIDALDLLMLSNIWFLTIFQEILDLAAVKNFLWSYNEKLDAPTFFRVT